MAAINRVAVTGASGFIGRATVAMLQAHGYRPIALGRNPASLEGADAIINLRGEPISGRWSAKKKAAIAASRIDGTARLVANIAASPVKPQVFISASAVGYYGDRGDEELLESSPPGSDFLAGVCTRWEAAAQAATALGVRVVVLRFGIVLGHGGALAQMKPLFALGLGGPMGTGQQYLPWIHLDDLTSLFRLALENSQLAGAVNAVAPETVTNAQFARSLGAALRRPAVIPAPAFALRIVLGEFAETLLASQRAIPAVAQSAGFRWAHAQLEPALHALVR